MPWKTSVLSRAPLVRVALTFLPSWIEGLVRRRWSTDAAAFGWQMMVEVFSFLTDSESETLADLLCEMGEANCTFF